MSSIATALAGLAAVGSVASAGASIYGSTQAGGGGGSSVPILPVNMSQGRFDLNALFGDKSARDTLNRRERQGHGSIFGPDFRDVISQYMQPTTFGPGGPGILSSLIGDPQQYLSQFRDSLGFLDEAVGTAREANQTGLLTDGSSYFDEAIRRYMTEALPEAAETSGLGVSSSGFQAAASRASENLLGQASLANIDLAEAAANRRLQSAPLLQGLTAARQALPLNLADQLGALFNFEAGKPIDMFSRLVQLSNTGAYAAPAYSPTNSGSATTAAIMAGLGQLGTGLGSVINRTGGSTTYNPQNWGPLPSTDLGPPPSLLG